MGFYHVGVLKALMENHLMPRVIGGSSAGSIVCAMVGTRTDEECQTEMFLGQGTHAPGHSGTLNFNFFRPMPTTAQEEDEQQQQQQQKRKGNLVLQDPKRTWQVFVPIGLRTFTSFLYDIMTGSRRPQDAFMNDTNHFRNIVKGNIGNFTFQEAFDRTGRILNIVVTRKYIIVWQSCSLFGLITWVCVERYGLFGKLTAYIFFLSSTQQRKMRVTHRGC